MNVRDTLIKHNIKEFNSEKHNVEFNGKYAKFCTLQNLFETPFINKDDFEILQGKDSLFHITRLFYKPLEELSSNCFISFEDAIHLIRRDRTREQVIECLTIAFNNTETAEKILREHEVEYHQVTYSHETKLYTCPNCDFQWERGIQNRCENCNVRLIWNILHWSGWTGSTKRFQMQCKM